MVTNLVLALQEEEPVIDVNSSGELKAKQKKWRYSNRVCLMTMKYIMDKIIGQSVLEFEKAKTFLKSIVEKFVKFDKVENITTSHYLKRPHIMVSIEYENIS